MVGGVALLPAVAVAEIIVTTSWRDATTWMWQAEIPAPHIQISKEQGQPFTVIHLEGLQQWQVIGQPEIPVYVQLFNALPEEITFKTTGSELQELQLPAPCVLFSDYPKTGDPDSGTEEFRPTIDYPFPLHQVQLQYLGKVRGAPLTRLMIFPFQVQADRRTLVFYRRWTVQVNLRPSHKLISDESLMNDPVIKNLPVAARSWRREVTPALSKTSSVLPLNQPMLKIGVNKDGIYRLSRKDIESCGLKLKNVDPRSFRMFNRGKEVPIFVQGESDGVFDAQDYVEFYGQELPNTVAAYKHDPFTSTNVYWLFWGGADGLRYAEETAKPTVPANQAIVPIDYLYTAHIEKDVYFDRLGQVDVNQPTYVSDHWFFDGGINGGTTQRYAFELFHPNTNTTKNFNARIKLHGLTYQTGEHNVTVFINNKQVAQGKWSAQTPYLLTNPINQVLRNSFLSHGDNYVEIAVSGDDPTNRYDKILFDWLEIDYYRLYKATADEIDFYRPKGLPNGLYQFTLTGFKSPDIAIYKIGQSKLRDFDVIWQSGTSTYSVVLQDNVYDDSTYYWATSALGMKSPYYLKCDTLTGLAQEVRGADILIITPQRWVKQLQPLEDFYRSQGLTPFTVSVTKIYNEFNAGIVSPFAIKDFLRMVLMSWRPVPEYVLFVGRADLKEQENVPAFFFQTYKYGASASDFWYTLIDDDEVPDYAVGRWPCRTEEELKLLIEKRINYTKKNNIGEWNNELLFIAGLEDVFKIQSDNMIQRQVDKAFNCNRIYINPSSVGQPVFGNSDSLINLFNRGIVLGNFYGHGGGAVWADRSLFNTSHIKYLDNRSRLPFLTSMTCFTGDFTNVTGLGTHLLLAENGGAIGLWGATSVGWIKNDYLLAKNFYDVIFYPGMSVGKAISTAKIKYLTQMEHFDYLKSSMVHSYNLIGDPTINLPFPERKIALNLDKDVLAPGDTLTVTGQLPFSKGSLFLQLHDSTNSRLYKEPVLVPFSSATFSYTLPLPQTMPAGGAYLNYYLQEERRSTDAHGVSLFNIKGLTFYGFSALPPIPAKNSLFDLMIYTEVADIQKLYCRVDTVGAYEYLDENGLEHVVSFQSGTNYLDLEMEPLTGRNQWHLKSPISIGTAGKLIALNFIARSRSDSVVSNLYAVRIKREPDFYPVAIGQGGTNFPELQVSVWYTGDDTVETDIRVEKLTIAGPILFKEVKQKFLPNRMHQIGIAGILGRQWTRFRVTVDPHNRISESNEANNTLADSLFVSTFPVIPGLGTSYDGVANDTLTWGDVFKLHISGEHATDSAAICLSTDYQTGVPLQPAFSLISPLNSEKTYNFQVDLRSRNAKPLAATLAIDLSSGDTTQWGAYRIGKWYQPLRIWMCETTQRVGRQIQGSVTLPGVFGIISSTDVVPPHIELNLEGQTFFQNSYVADRPSVSIIGEDDNGVRFDAQGLKVWIDDNQVEFSDLGIADTIKDGRFISAQLRPSLNVGSHTLKVSLMDASGNRATKELNFIVSDELRLVDYGTYPNPFKDKTTFIYDLTQRVSSFKIKIYTVSGRLIRVLEEGNVYNSGANMNEGGYHEVTWDGRDQDGNFVANGVYFYKMIARKGERTVTAIGKMAKAR